MSCGIYQILNTVTGKCYVGSSVNIKRRHLEHLHHLKGNAHHSIKLQRAWNKYGPTVWKWNILQECEIDKLDWLEMFWQARMNSFHSGYDSTLLILENDKICRRASEETKAKMRNTAQNRTNDHKKKIGDAHRGKIISDEHKARLREVNTGKEMSDENKVKVSKFHKGRKRPLETIVKMRGQKRKEETKARMRKPKSEEAKKNMRGRVKNIEERQKISDGHKGKQFSEEHKAKLRIAHKNAWARRKAKQVLELVAQSSDNVEPIVLIESA